MSGGSRYVEAVFDESMASLGACPSDSMSGMGVRPSTMDVFLGFYRKDFGEYYYGQYNLCVLEHLREFQKPLPILFFGIKNTTLQQLPKSTLNVSALGKLVGQSRSRRT
jgi:hypothetical protein